VSAELPRELAEAVERLLAEVPPRELGRASAELSDRYRDRRERRAPVARSREQALAYAATRLPATYAAVSSALGAVRQQRPGWQPRTVLDLGAGPGTGLWSAATVWPSLEHATAVEAEPEMIALGRRLAESATHPAVRAARWLQADVAATPPSTPPSTPDGPYDLVLVAYVLGELDPARRDLAIDRAAEATAGPAGTTVVVEPGTPEGYARMLRARDRLLARGGFTTAPCPHDRACPMAGRDWCHFAVRLPRTWRHRAAKGGSLGYEDEKYAYVAVSRRPTERTEARVVRHPQSRPRLIQLALCTTDGLKSVVVTRSDRERFRRARKVNWGDGFDYTAEDATDDATSA
jgi:ribosomal protein RSM22 (predicted rRNA methylase)